MPRLSAVGISGLQAGEDVNGEIAIPDDRRRFSKLPFTVNLSGRVRRDCELVRMRYGISREELMEMAPLMFTLVAEDSLSWRRDRVKRARQLIRDMDFAQELMGLKLPINRFDLDETGEPPGMEDSEELSIASQDVFGEKVGGPRGLNCRVPRVFSDYLLNRVRNEELDGVLALWEEDLGIDEDESLWGNPTQWPGDRLPLHRLLPDQIYELIGLGPEASPTPEQFQALMALNLCQVELADLPDELMGEDKASERVTWINQNAATAP